MRQINRTMWLKITVIFSLISLSVFATGIDDRIACQTIEDSINKETCTSRGCTWKDLTDNEKKKYPEMPQCYADGKIGYKVEKQTSNSGSLLATLNLTTPGTKQIACAREVSLNVVVSYVTDKILRIKINSDHPGRYEVPIQEDYNIPSTSSSNLLYKIALKNDDASIVVTRNDNNAKLIDTSINGLIFCDRYIQFATYLPKDADFYGFGENYRNSFQHDTGYKTKPIFSHAAHFGSGSNGYGQHSFMMGIQKDGKAFGLFFLNSNAMAYTFLPSPALSMKMTGGIIDVFVILGDNAEQVVQQYTSIIGRSMMPPFWALGFHNGRRYSVNNVEQPKKVIDRFYRHNIPLDVVHLFREYMENFRVFTYDMVNLEKLPQLISETKPLRWSLSLTTGIEASETLQNGKKYEPWIDILKNDAFVRWPDEVGKKISFPPGVPTDKYPFYAKVGPYNEAPRIYPDFFKKFTNTWWKSNINKLYQQLNFDSLYLNENSPNSVPLIKECPNDDYNVTNVVMKFSTPLHSETLCMGVKQGDKFFHFDVHSLYGLMQSIPTFQAVRESTGKRGLVLSESTYPGSGKYVAKMFSYNHPQWESMKQSIISIMEFSLFGFAFTGSDICALYDTASPDLCRRWYQLGAFYPFSRAVNDLERDPGWWAENGHLKVTKAAVDSLRVRYQLLHYLYTAFYNAHVNGDTVARPMHHVFTFDEKSRTVDTQFFLGPSVMVTPFLMPNQSSLDAYLPDDEIEWFKLSEQFVQKVTPVNDHIRIEDSESSRPLFFRGGSILPVVSFGDLPEPLNTVSLRAAPISLWVLPDFEGSAFGQLFFDDGESIDTVQKEDYVLYDFSLKKCVLTINVDFKKFDVSKHAKEALKLKQIYIALNPDARTTILPENIDFKTDNDKVIPKPSLTLNVKHSIKLKFTEPLDLLHSINKTLKFTFFDKEDSEKHCFLDN